MSAELKPFDPDESDALDALDWCRAHNCIVSYQSTGNVTVSTFKPQGFQALGCDLVTAVRALQAAFEAAGIEVAS